MTWTQTWTRYEEIKTDANLCGVSIAACQGNPDILAWSDSYIACRRLLAVLGYSATEERHGPYLQQTYERDGKYARLGCDPVTKRASITFYYHMVA